MQKLSLEKREEINCGFAWNIIAAGAVITSMSVSLICNLLNIVNSTKTRSKPIEIAKLPSTNSNSLTVKLF